MREIGTVIVDSVYLHLIAGGNKIGNLTKGATVELTGFPDKRRAVWRRVRILTAPKGSEAEIGKEYYIAHPTADGTNTLKIEAERDPLADVEPLPTVIIDVGQPERPWLWIAGGCATLAALLWAVLRWS